MDIYIYVNITIIVVLVRSPDINRVEQRQSIHQQSTLKLKLKSMKRICKNMITIQSSTPNTTDKLSQPIHIQEMRV